MSEDLVDDHGRARGPWIMSGVVGVVRPDIGPGSIRVGGMAGISGVDGWRIRLQLKVEAFCINKHRRRQ